MRKCSGPGHLQPDRPPRKTGTAKSQFGDCASPPAGRVGARPFLASDSPYPVVRTPVGVALQTRSRRAFWIRRPQSRIAAAAQGGPDAVPGVRNRTARRATTMIACPSCGYETADDFAFCPKCATALVAPRAASEERKVVTTLFCDLVGFTAMSEAGRSRGRRPPARRVRRPRHASVIESHGGVVEKFIGDAVVGVFGVPAVREDDPERAVRAALHLLRAIEGLTRPDGSPLQARVGVNTGEALVRLDVDPSSGRGFLTGDAVNVAARLQAAAPPMGLVVGALTHRLTAAAFTYEALAPLSLKGKSRPVAAWLAHETDAASERPGATTATPMVGRAAELATCLQAVDRLHTGEGGLLLITGEAGIGKTRLVEELRLRATGQGVGWLEGRTLSFGRSISYWPFLEIIQQDAGIDSDDGEAERWAKLAARLSDLFGDEAPEVLPYLATLLSVPLPEELAAEDSAPRRRGDGPPALPRLTPLLHAPRTGETTGPRVRGRALAGRLLRRSARAPVAPHRRAAPPGVLRGAARARHGAHAERSNSRARTTPNARREIALQPLSPEQSETLVHNLVDLDDLPAGLRDLILAKAEGNPFFVEEIVRSLIDLGGLVRDRSTNSYRVTERATPHQPARHPGRRDHGARRPPRRRPQAGAASGLGDRAQLLLPGARWRGRRDGAANSTRASPACRPASWCSSGPATPSSSTSSSTPSSRRRPTRAS